MGLPGTQTQNPRIKSLRTTGRSLGKLRRYIPPRAIYVQHLAPCRTAVARPSQEFLGSAIARLSHDPIFISTLAQRAVTTSLDDLQSNASPVSRAFPPAMAHRTWPVMVSSSPTGQIHASTELHHGERTAWRCGHRPSGVAPDQWPALFQAGLLAFPLHRAPRTHHEEGDVPRLLAVIKEAPTWPWAESWRTTYRRR